MEKTESVWETSSLEWIHKAREEMRRDRKGQPPQPMPDEEVRKRAKRLGLTVVGSLIVSGR